MRNEFGQFANLLDALDSTSANTSVLEKQVCRRAFLAKCGRWTGGIILTACLGQLVVSCGRKSEQDASQREYYLNKKNKLLEQARGSSVSLEQLMIPEYGQKVAGAIATDMVKTYDRMIGELPYIGGDKNAHMTDLMINASMSMAFCLAMKEHGKSIDDAGRINYEMIDQYYKENPLPPDKMYKSGDIEGKRREAREFAEWTQKFQYPYNWVSVYVGDVREPFIYGMDNVECGNLKLCKHYGIGGFTNYLCMLDNILYPARGQGLTRKMTLADGFDRCDFRFSEDGVVKLEEPFTVRKLREWGK